MRMKPGNSQSLADATLITHGLSGPPIGVRARRWMGPVSLTLLAGVLAGAPALAGTPAGWRTNLTAGLEEAGNLGRPVLLYFTASWCGPCQAMARTTLRDQALTNLIATLIPVALDLDEHSDLARTHGVTAVPHFEMLSPVGDTVTQTTGYQQPDEFIQWITNSVEAVRTAAIRRKKLETKLAAARWVLANDPQSVGKAAGWLFDLCAERENDVQRAAMTELGRLAARDPALLIDGLNHPRLATRICVANLLRPRLGETFNIDPWDDAQSRQQAVAQWREKLRGGPETR